MSFPNREQSVALELFEAFDAYCKRTGSSIFHLHLRLSQENVNPERWNDDWIRQQIGKFGPKNIQRVWVCGPPVLNETFDRLFSTENNRVGLTSDQYEIL